jgi:hypothetical protein
MSLNRQETLSTLYTSEYLLHFYMIEWTNDHLEISSNSHRSELDLVLLVLSQSSLEQLDNMLNLLEMSWNIVHCHLRLVHFCLHSDKLSFLHQLMGTCIEVWRKAEVTSTRPRELDLLTLRLTICLLLVVYVVGCHVAAVVVAAFAIVVYRCIAVEMIMDGRIWMMMDDDG